MKRVLVLAAAFSVFWGGAAQGKAGPITYTLSGTGTGKLGTDAFANALVIVTSEADTSNIVHSNLYVVQNELATVFVSGLGTATFTDATQTVANLLAEDIGIGDVTHNAPVLFEGDNPFVFAYNLATSIGPETGDPIFNVGSNSGTTDGNFELTSFSEVTFQAQLGSTITATPEPATLTLLAIGIAGMAGYGWRRRKVAAA